MTPTEREEMKRRAEAKLAAMRERGRRLRSRVLTGAAIGFAVLWVAIFTQMISGHDPALGPVTAAVRPATEEGAAQEHEALSDGEDENQEDEEGSRPAPVEEAVAPVEEAEELEAATTGQS